MVEELRGRARERRAASQVDTTATIAAIRAAATARKRDITAAAAAASTSVRGEIAQARAQVHAQTRAAQTTVTQTLTTTRTAIGATSERKVTEVTTAATERKQRLRDGTRTKKEDARRMGETEGGRGARQNETDAATARQRGRDKAATYPADGRGRAQAEAARASADRVATEIGHNTHEMRSFASETAAEASNGFDERATGAIAQIDQHMPDVSGPIRDVGRDAQRSLDGAQRDAFTQLRRVDTEADEGLRTLETTSIGQLNDIARRVSSEIDAAAASGISGAQTQLVSLNLRIDSQVDSAATFLLGILEPDVSSAREVVDRMTGFVSASGTILGTGLAEYQREVATRFATAVTGGQTAIAATRQQTTAGVGTVRSGVTTSVNGVVTAVRTQCTRTTSQAAEAQSEIVSGVVHQLDDAVRQTLDGFTNTINRAQAQIRAKIDEGLGKNVEALARLDRSMTDAAEQAAWDVDHPVLSTLRDVGLFVLAFVAAVLLVIAIVVVVIVLAKVALAALVTIGLSALAAKIVLIVVAVGVAGYMIYRSYSARRARIEHEEATETRFETFLRSAGEMFGVTQIAEGFTERGLTPFERGWKIGEGVATLASWFLGGKISGRIDAAIPRMRWVPNWIKNPVRGSALRWMQGRFGSPAAEVPRFEPGRITGGGPAAGEVPRFEPAPTEHPVEPPAQHPAPADPGAPRPAADPVSPQQPAPVDPATTPRRPDLRLIQGEGGGTPPRRVPQAAPIPQEVPHVRVVGGEPIPLEPTTPRVNEPMGIRRGEPIRAMSGEPPGGGGNQRPPGGGGTGEPPGGSGRGGRRPPGGGEPPVETSRPANDNIELPADTTTSPPQQPMQMRVGSPDAPTNAIPSATPARAPGPGGSAPRRLVVGATPGGSRGPIPDPAGYDVILADAGRNARGVAPPAQPNFIPSSVQRIPASYNGTFSSVLFERLTWGARLDASAIDAAARLLESGGTFEFLGQATSAFGPTEVEAEMLGLMRDIFNITRIVHFVDAAGNPHVLITGTKP